MKGLGIAATLGCPCLVGIDFHPAAHLCRAKGYRVLEGLFEHVEPGPGRYRLVVMNQLIEHMVDPLAALQKLGRILVPGGVAFIETPDTACLNARLAPKRYWAGYHYPRHLHLFDPESMTRALELAGLEVLQIRHVPCPIPWITTGHAWLQERRQPHSFGPSTGGITCSWPSSLPATCFSSDGEPRTCRSSRGAPSRRQASSGTQKRALAAGC